MLSIYFSPNKHKILSASFSSSTLKSDVRRKQKCPILPPVFCFRDGINLSEPIICSDLLGILHCMSMRESSIESLWFSRIYLFFSPPSGWLAGCGPLQLWQCGTSAIPPCACLAAPSLSSALSWESLPPHQASQGDAASGRKRLRCSTSSSAVCATSVCSWQKMEKTVEELEHGWQQEKR